MTDILRLAVTPEILSWTSTSVNIAAAPYKGIQSIKFEEKRERKKVMGMDRAGKPVGVTSGKYTAGPGSMKMLADSFKILTAQLAIIGLGSYGDAKVPMIVKYEEPLDPTGLSIIVFDRLWIAGPSDDLSEGNDENVVDVSFDCMGITRNGLSLYSRVRDLPL